MLFYHHYSFYVEMMFISIGKGLMVLNLIIYHQIEILRIEWWYATVFTLFYCYFYFIYIVICMVHLWWRCYVFYLQLTWPCRRYFMQYDDPGLVGTTWSNVDICVFYYVKYYGIYLHVKQCESICVLLMLCRWSY